MGNCRVVLFSCEQPTDNGLVYYSLVISSVGRKPAKFYLNVKFRDLSIEHLHTFSNDCCSENAFLENKITIAGTLGIFAIIGFALYLSWETKSSEPATQTPVQPISYGNLRPLIPLFIAIVVIVPLMLVYLAYRGRRL